MKKIFAMCLPALGFVLPVLAGPGTPGTLKVNINTTADNGGMVPICYISGNTLTYENIYAGQGKKMPPVVRKLTSGAQIVLVDNKTYLISAGESLNVDVSMAKANPNAVVIQKEPAVPPAKRPTFKQLLPSLVDSVYNVNKMPGTRGEVDAHITAGQTYVAAQLQKVQLSAEERAILNAYEGYHKMIFRGVFFLTNPDLAKVTDFEKWYFEGFDLADPNYSSIAHTGVYQNISTFWWNARKAIQPKLKEEDRMFELLFQAKSDRLKEEVSKTWVYSQTRVHQFSPALKAAYKPIMAALKPSPIRQYIDSFYRRYERLDRGKPAYDIVMKNEAGRTVRLSDYRGKMVVIDVWADYCSGCIAGLPHFMEIADRFKDKKDIVFLTLAWQAPGTEEDWKTMSDKHKVNGVNNLLVYKDYETKFGAAFIEGYCMTGIPRYMVIDKEGNFVDGSMPYPDYKKMGEMIEDYYNELR